LPFSRRRILAHALRVQKFFEGENLLGPWAVCAGVFFPLRGTMR
jgi:hypothetical protein